MRERDAICIGSTKAYNRAIDERVLAVALDSDVQVDQKLKNSMFYT